MTSRPTLIQSLRLDYSTLASQSLTHSLLGQTPLNKHVHTHSPPTYPEPSVLLENYRRFSLRR